VVLAVDLARSAKDPASMKAFTSVCTNTHKMVFSNVTFFQWANSIINSCPISLQERFAPSFGLLKNALLELQSCYIQPVDPLIPRPALMLVGAVASSIYLLEHATWSYKNSELTKELDSEVFRRWVLEGEVEGALQALRRIRTGDSRNRAQLNSRLAFGGVVGPKL